MKPSRNPDEFASGDGTVFADPNAPVALPHAPGLPTGALAVEHLQLRKTVTAALRACGVTSLAAATAFVLRKEIETFPHAAELAEAICQLQCCLEGGYVDWPRYWRARNFQFHYLNATLPALDRLDERSRSHPVGREILGLAGQRLARVGYRDLGSLTDGLRARIPVPAGVGAGKLQDFFKRLVILAERVSDSGELVLPASGDSRREPATHSTCFGQLPRCVAELPIDALCIGVKCRLVRDAGYHTAGDLTLVPADRLLKIPSVGRKTVTLMLERLESLYALQADAAAVRLRAFRFGRRADQLEEEGCRTLGDVVDLAKSRPCAGGILEHLDFIADCLDSGNINWVRYRETLALPVVPAAPPTDPASFVSGFAATVHEILQRASSISRAAAIFWERTRHAGASRPTLARVGDLLGTHGSTIKREETDLLEELHGILVTRNFSRLPFWVHAGWLSFLDDAHDAFGRYPDDFDGFVTALAVRWQLTLRRLDAAAPTMWAIFTGYPVYRRRTRAVVSPEATAHAPSRIRLRGFRTVH
jgi:hypothetical protein